MTLSLSGVALGVPRSTPRLDRLPQALVEEGLAARNRMAALAYIFDRLEGRPRQEIDVRSISDDVSSRSDQELPFYLDNGRWPDADALLLAEANGSNGAGTYREGHLMGGCNKLRAPRVWTLPTAYSRYVL